MLIIFSSTVPSCFPLVLPLRLPSVLPTIFRSSLQSFNSAILILGFPHAFPLTIPSFSPTVLPLLKLHCHQYTYFPISTTTKKTTLFHPFSHWYVNFFSGYIVKKFDNSLICPPLIFLPNFPTLPLMFLLVILPL